MFPGDTLQDGTVLRVGHGQCGASKLRFPGETEDPPVIYVSPTINYASAPVYAAPFSVAGRKVQAVFQCRVKPGSYVRFQDTLPKYRPKDGVWDSEFGNDVLEWIVRDKEAVVPYRLLLRWA